MIGGIIKPIHKAVGNFIDGNHGAVGISVRVCFSKKSHHSSNSSDDETLEGSKYFTSRLLREKESEIRENSVEAGGKNSKGMR